MTIDTTCRSENARLPEGFPEGPGRASILFLAAALAWSLLPAVMTGGSAPLRRALGEEPLAASGEAAVAGGMTTPANAASPAPANAPGPTPTNVPPKVEEFNPQELEGADAKVAELAAHRLLQAIARKDAAVDSSRVPYLSYLLEKLAPAKVSATKADAVVATRIVDALATLTTSSGPPFPKVEEVLLPLLGTGPKELEDAVARALGALLRHEFSPTKISPTAQILTSRFIQNPPPSEGFVREASRVLWGVEGKALIDALMSALAVHGGSPPNTPGYAMATASLGELRARLPIDFPNLQGWQKWWGEQRDSSLENILAKCQLRAQEESVATWKQVIRRLRESGDAERLLLAIKDTLEMAYGPDLRTATVSAIGDFAEWIAETPLDKGAGDSSPSESDPKEKLLRRGFETLYSLLVRKDFYVERPQVVRAAFAALGRYHGLLDRNPDLLGEISKTVTSRLAELSLGDREANRKDLLETLRLAGVFRASGALEFVQLMLTDAYPPVAPATDPPGRSPETTTPGGTEEAADLELHTVLISTLGRLVEKKGIGRDTASLILRAFKTPRRGPEKAVREFRRVCVAALGAEALTPEVLSELGGFYRGILSSGDDKDLRIPAILGLGILARQKNADAFKALTEVLEKGEQYEPQEVIAAADSIAYVGGEPAIFSFVRCLGTVKDKSVQDHLWKKVVGLIVEGGLETLMAGLLRLQQLAFEEDNLAYLELSAQLGQEAQVKDLLAGAKQGLGGSARLEALWAATLALARSHDLLGKEEEAAGYLGQLSEILQKEPLLKDKIPRGVSDLADFKSILAQRTVLQGKLAKATPNELVALVKEIEELVRSGTDVATRWGNLRWAFRQLSQGAPSEKIDRLRELWYLSLSSEQSKSIWDGFSAKLRERHLGRLDALKGKTKPTEGGAPK